MEVPCTSYERHIIMAAKIFIPQLSEGEMYARAETVKPVVRFNGVLHYIKDVDLFNISYIWSPEKADVAPALVPLEKIVTYHSYGHPALFKPSIAEVLAQIPCVLVKKVCAFELVERPHDVNDLNRDSEALQAGYHVAKVQLYTKE